MRQAIEKDKKFIRQGFDEIAYKYDLFNCLVSFGRHQVFKKALARKTIQMILTNKSFGKDSGKYSGKDSGKYSGKILDICCGTGDITYQLENFAPQNYEIIGMDFSSAMLKIAEKKKKENSKIRFVFKDVLPLPFAKDSLTAITVGFGLRNLTDLDFALQEIYRCLKKGGVFACLDMGKVTFPIASQMFQFFFFKLVPLLGKYLVPKSKMFCYFPNSTKDYPSPQELVTKLNAVGFRESEFQKKLCGACVVHFAQKP